MDKAHTNGVAGLNMLHGVQNDLEFSSFVLVVSLCMTLAIGKAPKRPPSVLWFSAVIQGFEQLVD